MVTFWTPSHTILSFNPLQNNKFLDWSKLKASADDKINFNPLPDDKFWTLPNWKSLQTTISNLMKMAESYSNW